MALYAYQAGFMSTQQYQDDVFSVSQAVPHSCLIYSAEYGNVTQSTPFVVNPERLKTVKNTFYFCHKYNYVLEQTRS